MKLPKLKQPPKPPAIRTPRLKASLQKLIAKLKPLHIKKFQALKAAGRLPPQLPMQSPSMSPTSSPTTAAPSIQQFSQPTDATSTSESPEQPEESATDSES